MCKRHPTHDHLAPGVCINCNLTGDAMAWSFVALCAIYVLGQFIRSWAFFLGMAKAVW